MASNNFETRSVTGISDLGGAGRDEEADRPNMWDS